MPINKKPTSPWCCFGDFSRNNDKNVQLDLKANILDEDSLSTQPQAVTENQDKSIIGKAPLVRSSERNRLPTKKVLNPTLSNEKFEVVDPSKLIPTDQNAHQDEYKEEYKESDLSQSNISIAFKDSQVYEEEEEETKEDLLNKADPDSDTDTGTDYQDAEGEAAGDDEIIKELEQRLEALTHNKEADSAYAPEVVAEKEKEKENNTRTEEPVEKPNLVTTDLELIDEVSKSDSKSSSESGDKASTPIKSSSEPSLSNLDKQENDSDSKTQSLSDIDVNTTVKSERSDTPRPAILLSSSMGGAKLDNKQEKGDEVEEDSSGVLSETEHSLTL